MNSRRLARLMGIICEIKAHPRRDPDEMCRRLSISRRQFYKDRETLAGMGFAFHFSRRLPGFVLDKELTFNVSGMSLADLFALVLAVRELTQLSDFALAMGALSGLKNLVGGLPESIKDTFSEAMDKVVVADGFNCRPEVLYDLQPAIAEHRRVVLEMTNPAKGGAEESEGQGQRLGVDPKRLFLREGILYLEAAGMESGGTNLVALSRVRRVIATPFYSPED